MDGGAQEPARILVLASTYPRWPGDTLPPFVHELARRLTGRFEVHVLVPHTAGAQTTERMEGVHVHRFQYLPARFETLAYGGGMLPGLRTRPWRLLALPLFLAAEFVAAVRLLRRQRFAAIHAHWLIPHGLIAVWARAWCGYRPALVCTAHGADVYGLKGRIADALRRHVIARSQRVAAVSQAMARDLARGTDAQDRLVVLPMGVDMETRFVPAASSQDPDRLLFVGRLAEKKGVEVLLQAMARLTGASPRLRLSIVGDGSEAKKLRRRSVELGLERQVEFLGAIPNHELPGWYQRAGILAFPSVVTSYGDQEGLGLVPIEALACGCAVVASDLPAIRDVIRHSETGLLAAPGDPAALAAALQSLLADPVLRRRLAAQGRTYVQAHFEWSGIAARYAQLFDAALQELSRP